MAHLKAVLAAALVFVLVGASLPDNQLTAGRVIFNEGGGAAITATMGSPPTPIGPRARACALCHGATGLGESEGGVVAPPLARQGLSAPELANWLEAALRDGRGAGNRSLLRAMPRYTISESDLAALAHYVRTLPYPPQTGLDGDQIQIGLDLAGSNFTVAEQTFLAAGFAQAIGRINADGGIFGRTIAPTSTAAESFITINWSATADRPNLSILASMPNAAPCLNCCGSLHASVREQVDWLTRWLEAQQISASYTGSLAPAQAADASLPSAVVHIGAPREAAPLPDKPLYLLADLGKPPPHLIRRPQTYLVVAVDMDQRMAAVSTLQRKANTPLSSPRLKGATIELDDALTLITGALARMGRRATTIGLCNELRRSTVAARQFSVIDMSTGKVVGQSGEPQKSR